MTILRSKYDSRCVSCGREILKGDRVSWVKGIRGARHAECSTEGQKMVAEVAKSKATKVDVALATNIPAPEGLAYLPFQIAGIHYAMSRKATLIADEMGLGKTVQAIGVTNAVTDIHSVLVICTKSTKRNWMNEFRRWTTRGLRPVIFKAGASLDLFGSEVTIINYDQLGKLPTDLKWDLLIVDEAHRVKNPDAQRTQYVLAISKRCGRRLFLTGTPIEDRPIDLWPILQMLWPERFDPAGTLKKKNEPARRVGAGEGAWFFRYAKKFCDAKKLRFGNVTRWDFSGHSNEAEFQELLRSTVMVRRLKLEVLKDLPAKRRQVVELAVSDEDMLDPYSDLDGDDFDSLVDAGKKVKFEVMSTVRRKQAMKKLPLALEHIEDALEGTKKIVVFAHHHEVVEALRDGLEAYNPAVLYGDTSERDRAAAVERFQTDDDCRIFIGSIAAAGEGITLTAATLAIFVELDWTIKAMNQAEDRIHRIGQLMPVLIQHLVGAGTLDSRICTLLVEKQRVADMALDDEPKTLEESKSRESPKARRERLLAEAKLTEKEVATVHAQLKYLAGNGSSMASVDGSGYERRDTNFGKALAEQRVLSVNQVVAAKRMLVKYVVRLSRGGFA